MDGAAPQGETQRTPHRVAAGGRVETRRRAMQEALNHAKLAMLFRKEFDLCNVKNGETVVLLSDLGARRDYVSAAFAAFFFKRTAAYEMCVNAMPSWTKVG